MSSHKITESVMGVMINPQNKAKNGCNDYITPITPGNSAPLNMDEVKELYLKLRASGVDPTANILHRSIGHGSLSTLQYFVNEFNEAYVKNQLSEIDKKRVPNETIEQIVHDLTDVCIKVKLKEDDSKIDTLNSMLLKAYQERKSSEEELTATIDKANSEISTLTSKVSELEIDNSRLLSENNALRDQVNVLSRERADDGEKYQYLEGMSNLLKRASLDPEGISKLLEELNKKNNGEEENKQPILGVIGVMKLAERAFLGVSVTTNFNLASCVRVRGVGGTSNWRQTG